MWLKSVGNGSTTIDTSLKWSNPEVNWRNVYYFRVYWPLQLVFIITCVIYFPNVRKIGRKLWSLLWPNGNVSSNLDTDTNKKDIRLSGFKYFFDARQKQPSLHKDAITTTHQRQPCLPQSSLPRSHTVHASTNTEQSLLLSDSHPHTRRLIRRPSAQLSHLVLFQVFAEHQLVQPVKYITAGQHFTLQLSYSQLL